MVADEPDRAAAPGAASMAIRRRNPCRIVDSTDAWPS
jgi:hypothetical protein